MTTEPLPPTGDAPEEPATAPVPARTYSRPSRGVVFALLGAFLLGGLMCGGVGLAAGVLIGHHGGRHEVGFDRGDRHDRGERLRPDPWQREQKLRDLRDQELKRQLLERLRLRCRDAAQLPCPPVAPMPVPSPPAAPAPSPTA